MSPQELQAYVEAAAVVQGLKLTDAQRPGVLNYFGLAAQFAAIVDAVPLSPHDESALRFEPVAPERSDPT
jgi:hypothetical protein